MKKIVLATILATVGSASALAADSSAPTYGKSPVMVEPAFNWSGFYIGGNIGRHWGRDQITSTADAAGGLGLGVDGAAAIDAASPTSLRPQGFIGGIQAGYNWQVNTVVFGFEADANWLGGTASRTLHGIPVINPGDFMTNSASATFLATFRPRVGLVFDRALLYVTGGLAVGTVKTSASFAHFGGAEITSTFDSTTREGWTVGGGVEYALNNNWSAKVEYLYVDLGSFDTVTPRSVLAEGAPDAITIHHKYTDNIARVGLNYKWGGPAAARY